MAHNVKQVALKDYLSEVDKTNITIPEFQRNFVWSKSNMIKLVSSLLKGYPIGSFLLMENLQGYANNPVQGVEEKSKNLDINKCLLILDGQQRTTTLYQVLYSKGEFEFFFNLQNFIEKLEEKKIHHVNDTNIDEIIEDNIENWIVAFEKKNKKIPNLQSEQISRGLFPISSIFVSDNETDYSSWLNKYVFDRAKSDLSTFNKLNSVNSIFINRLINNIVGYQTSQIIIDGNTSANIVCTIFETINSTGVKLTVLDLLNAKCFPANFALSKKLETTFDELPLFKDFDNDDKDEIIGLALIKLVGLFEGNSCKKSYLLNLDPKKIKARWDISAKSINSALEFMKEHFGVLGYRYLPYRDMLPCIARIINDSKFDRKKPLHIKKIARWYWHCILTGHFDNATEAKNAAAVLEFLGDDKRKGWLDDNNEIPGVIRLNYHILKESNFEAIKENLPSNSALYKAILNLIVLQKAQDFKVGKKTLSTYSEKDLQDHHIFPKKFLSSYKIKDKDANSILNRTLISIDANQKIKDKQPSVYFKDTEIFGKSIMTKEELKKHFIDDEFVDEKFAKGVFSPENFKKFKETRHKMIVEILKNTIAE